MPDETKPEAPTTELNEDQLESVAGGIIDGGCIPDPFKPTPTFPPNDPVFD